MQRIYGFVQEEDGVVSKLLTEISAYFEYLAHQHGDYVAFHNVKIPMEGYMAQLAPYNINRNPYCLYVKSKPETQILPSPHSKSHKKGRLRSNSQPSPDGQCTCSRPPV